MHRLTNQLASLVAQYQTRKYEYRPTGRSTAEALARAATGNDLE